ncbi:hypothetical protein C7H19_24605 [Aphanothece hegewaldii CCALA 016]|uniref:Uncharacterized protein n=2 Tax=Aphanothece TaxID=1121 RepID=A0A2T1LQL5_9CHRO|nr:hypothetical protein C7H19_24605 [Aphanothece hegewaldii CCALA 016]
MSYEIMREIAEEEYFRAEADAALYEEAERVTELHNQGESDGRRLKAPQHPEHWIYWDGYCQGVKQFWYKRLKLTTTNEI